MLVDVVHLLEVDAIADEENDSEGVKDGITKRHLIEIITLIT
jgi:hypothetical protein